MKYLKSIFFIFLCTITTNLYAQSVNETIEKQFKEYIQLSFEDFEKSLDYTPEEIFKTITKKEWIAIHEYILQMGGEEYIFLPPEITSFSEVIKIDGINYVKFQYLTKIQIPIGKSDYLEVEVLYSKNSYEQIYGKGNVAFNEKTHSFEVNQIGNVIAISNNLKNWKFVSVENKSQRPDVLHFIPKQLFE